MGWARTTGVAKERLLPRAARLHEHGGPSCRLQSVTPSLMRFALGRVAEWFKAPVLKTGVPARVPWVRIPPLPPPAFMLRRGEPRREAGARPELRSSDGGLVRTFSPSRPDIRLSGPASSRPNLFPPLTTRPFGMERSSPVHIQLHTVCAITRSPWRKP